MNTLCRMFFGIILIGTVLKAQVIEQDSVVANFTTTDQEGGVVIEDKLNTHSKARYELTYLGGIDQYRKKNILLIAAIENIRSTSIKGFITGLGFNYHKAYLLENEKSLSAIALKGRIGYILPTSIKTILMARISYAPQLLCLSDGMQSYVHARVLMDVNLFKQGSLVAGYRTIQYTFNDRLEYHFNDTFYLGGRIFF